MAIAEETEQRVGDKNQACDRGEQHQDEKEVRITLNHKGEIAPRPGDQGAAQ